MYLWTKLETVPFPFAKELSDLGQLGGQEKHGFSLVKADAGGWEINW